MSTQFEIANESTMDETTELTLSGRFVRSTKVKKVAFNLHKYVGVVAGVYMLIMSLTGIVLVFHDELSEWLNPYSPKIQGTERASFDRIFQNCETASPGFKFKNMMVDLDNHPTLVFGNHADGRKITCEANQFTGEFLKVRDENQILKFITDLHFNLLSGTNGRTANGIGGVILLMLTITGLMIWWRSINSFKTLFKLRPERKNNAPPVSWLSAIVIKNAHALFGVCFTPFLIIWSISGFYFGFPTFTEQCLNPILPVASQNKTSAEPSIKPNTDPSAKSRSADELVRAAQNAAPGFDFVTRIAMQDKRKKLARIWLAKTERETNSAKEKCQVFLDPTSATVVSVSRAENPLAGDVFLQTLTKLHFGTIGGIYTKCAWVVAGCIPAILSISGWLIFAYKSKRKRAAGGSTEAARKA